MAVAGARPVSASLAAVLVAAVTVMMAIPGLVAALLLGIGRQANIPLGLAIVAFGLVGALIIARVPGNRIGWVCAAIGIAAQLGGFQELVYPLFTRGVSLEMLALGQVLADAAWFTFIYLMLVLLVSWFPTGRALGPAWAWAVRIGTAVWLLLVVLTPLQASVDVKWPGLGWLEVDNPIGVAGISDPQQAVGGASFAVLAVVSVIGLVSMIVRRIRSRGVERLQMKWLIYSIAAVIAWTVLGTIFADWLDANLARFEWLTDLAFGLLVAAIPVSIGVAITRYRLYEIDRIINRTAVYAIVVAGLGVVFAAGALWVPMVLPIDNSNLAVAASTLAVFFLFQPLRLRAQRFVDRRFNRRKYDAEQVASEFSKRIRDEVDLATVARGLRSVVSTTMEPRSVAIWIKGVGSEGQ